MIGRIGYAQTTSKVLTNKSLFRTDARLLIAGNCQQPLLALKNAQYSKLVSVKIRSVSQNVNTQ
jgi:hypothetical protein